MEGKFKPYVICLDVQFCWNKIELRKILYTRHICKSKMSFLWGFGEFFFPVQIKDNISCRWQGEDFSR